MEWWQHKLENVSYLGDYRVHVRYRNALEADVDLSDLLTHPFYAPIKDKACFSKVAVDQECSVLVWPNDIDLAPEILFERAVQASRGTLA